MKIAYFDTFSGISGDMIIGAFLNSGVPFEYLANELSKLKTDNFEIKTEQIKRHHISATRFIVLEKTKHHHHHSTNLDAIKKIILESELEQNVKNRAIKIFEIIGNAEAKIHNIPLEKIHFHEVGAIDSIVDIVGISICLEYLKLDAVYTNVIPFGKGFIETEHGKLPIPAPASIEILKNYPIRILDIPYELTTPTGAAFVAAESKGVLNSEIIKIEKIGYGAGSKEIPDLPNLLRIFIGEIESHYDLDETVMIETNIDDMNPEFYPYILEKLFSKNISDAYITPVIMKKGRPGVLLSVLCAKSQTDEIINLIYKETTTLGVRVYKTERKKLERELLEIDTSFGKVKAKKVFYEKEFKIKPEYEECKRIAESTGLPIKEIYNQLIRELNKNL